MARLIDGAFVSLVVGFVVLQGCSGGGNAKPATDAAATICVPGATQSCLGPGVCAGAQSCLPNGGAWSPCDCGTNHGKGGSAGGGSAGGGGKAGAGGFAGRSLGGAAGLGLAGAGGGGKGGAATGGKGGGGIAGRGGTSGMGGLAGMAPIAGMGGVSGAGGGAGGVGGAKVCVKNCGTRTCGVDPDCGMSCGQCAGNETCTAAGQCLCNPGSTACSQDGYGFHVCSTNSTLGARIPCAPDVQCDATTRTCKRPPSPACMNTEAMLLVDRSSSMQDVGAFAWVRDGLAELALYLIHGNRIGVRQFPIFSGCSIGSAPPLMLENYNALVGGLSAPNSEGTTPVTAALTGVLPPFGDANDGQAVILISQGDENCSSQASALLAASAAWLGGVKVYVIAVTTTADRLFLDKVAAAGGTGTSRLATDKVSFVTALRQVFQELGACFCDQACQCGDGYFVPALEQCDDGNRKNGDGCSVSCQATGKGAFQTSRYFNGNLGGLEGADASCQTLAQAAGRTGTFKAWLSDSTHAAQDRLAHATEPYVLLSPDRPLVASSWTDLTDGVLMTSLTRDERGEPLFDDSAKVWTATHKDGAGNTDQTCVDWTSADTMQMGRTGEGVSISASWTEQGAAACNLSTFKLYCIEQ